MTYSNRNAAWDNLCRQRHQTLRDTEVLNREKRMKAIVVNTISKEKWEFDNVFMAEAFIDTLLEIDEAGVLAGEYQIDDMSYRDDE